MAYLFDALSRTVQRGNQCTALVLLCCGIISPPGSVCKGERQLEIQSSCPCTLITPCVETSSVDAVRVRVSCHVSLLRTISVRRVALACMVVSPDRPRQHVQLAQFSARNAAGVLASCAVGARLGVLASTASAVTGLACSRPAWRVKSLITSTERGGWLLRGHIALTWRMYLCPCSLFRSSHGRACVHKSLVPPRPPGSFPAVFLSCVVSCSPGRRGLGGAARFDGG